MMNKNIIKKFAVWARKELIMSVTRIASYYDIEPNNIKGDIDITTHGDILSFREKSQRKGLIEKIKSDGFDETMEEIAYTWFNRFIAIRFMEVNGYLPSHVRMFSDEDGKFNPEILSECLSVEIEGLDKEKVFELYDKANKEELFHYLIITQCNELSDLLPGIFEKISDYTELLLPNNLLKEGSVIKAMVENIPEEDWKEQVQIIGWLYQYYNTELKDEVINVKQRKSIEKKDIPAATQVFTTDWVVKYIVDNSLGRYWIERHPESNLKDKLEFFIPSKKGKIEYIDEKINPTELKILDNCMGSGHFLLYEFDVLIEIYKECGYREREAAEYILKNNLYGLDIDERARQLAYFSLMMKARSYNRRIFKKHIFPNIHAIPESNSMNKDSLSYFGNKFENKERENIINEINYLMDTFKDAKNYGSILEIEPCDFDKIKEFLSDINEGQINLFSGDIDSFREQLLNIVEVSKMMTMTYDVIATNPPYLNKYNSMLKKFIESHYPDYKADLFSVFIYRNFKLCNPDGYVGFMTPFVWMFIKNYELLRRYIINNKSLITLVQMEYSAFSEATIPLCAFVFQNTKPKKSGVYFKLSEFKGGMEVQKIKVLEALKSKDCSYLYEINQEKFKKIPGMPIAYWASDNLLSDFECANTMENILDVKQGLATADNNRFLRLWHEVNLNKCKFDAKNAKDLLESHKKWIPYNKGGKRRQWYGNYYYLVNWENDGYTIKHFFDYNGKLRSRPQNQEYYFKEAITWGLITSGGFSIRYRLPGGIHDVSGMSAFDMTHDNLKYILGVMSTKLGDYIFKILNPTLNLQVGDFQKFPVLNADTEIKLKVEDIVEENIQLSKLDWDMHETSWDFEESPLIKNKVDGLLSSAYESYKEEVNTRFETLKRNEEELNRIFIDLYGLQEELQPEVEDKDITVAKIFDSKDDIDVSIKGNRYVLTREDVVKNFLSYFIGCCMGRYSLDAKGITYAGGEFDSHKYQTFKADNDGIIPLTEKEFFEDDIIVRLEEFLTVTFGEETLNENLDFIACELKGKASLSSRDKIRNYFIKDFYKDHCKMYQKCPIYWQADSGKLGASRNLIYMHRYQKDTIASLRIRYVFEIQDRYNQELEHLEQLIDNTTSGSDRVKYQKQADKIKKLIIETQNYEEKVQHIADSYIEIDLDNGVKENYKLFEDIFSKIK